MPPSALFPHPVPVPLPVPRRSIAISRAPPTIIIDVKAIQISEDQRASATLYAVTNPALDPSLSRTSLTGRNPPEPGTKKKRHVAKRSTLLDWPKSVLASFKPALAFCETLLYPDLLQEIQ